MKLATSDNKLLHDLDLNHISFYTFFFAFCLAKAVVMIKGVRGLIIFLNFKPDGVGGGKCGNTCL